MLILEINYFRNPPLMALIVPGLIILKSTILVRMVFDSWPIDPKKNTYMTTKKMFLKRHP